MKRTITTLFIAALPLCSFAVSFDCNKASTFVEKEICNQPELGALDSILSNIYNDYINESIRLNTPRSSLDNIKEDQRAWLKQRNRCNTKDCIVEAYKNRKDKLCLSTVSGYKLVDCYNSNKNNNTKVYLYFASEKPPTTNVPAEAPLCYKFEVESVQDQLKKLISKYSSLYDYKIYSAVNSSQILEAKRKDEEGEVTNYFYSTDPDICMAHVRQAQMTEMDSSKHFNTSLDESFRTDQEKGQFSLAKRDSNTQELNVARIELEKLNKQITDLTNAGEYDRALQLALNAIQLSEEIIGPDDLVTAILLSKSAVLYLLKTDFDQAEPIFRRALEISEKSLGSEDPQVSSIRTALINLQQNRAKRVESEPLHILNKIKNIPNEKFASSFSSPVDAAVAYVIKQLEGNTITLLDSTHDKKYYLKLTKSDYSDRLLVWHLSSGNECAGVFTFDTNGLVENYQDWRRTQLPENKIEISLFQGFSVESRFHDFAISSKEYLKFNLELWLKNRHGILDKNSYNTFGSLLGSFHKIHPEIISTSELPSYPFIENDEPNRIKINDIEPLRQLGDKFKCQGAQHCALVYDAYSISFRKQRSDKSGKMNLFVFIAGSPHASEKVEYILEVVGTARDVSEYEKFNLPGPIISTEHDPEIICAPVLKDTLLNRLMAIQSFADEEKEIRSKLAHEERLKKDDAKRVEDEIKATAERNYKKYHGNNDIVRKVLNYTITGDDEGFFYQYWYPYEERKCVYKFHNPNYEILTGQAILDLNNVDPRNVEISQSDDVINITLDKEGQINSSSLLVNIDRLKRGWTKVFTEFCEGTRRDF